MINWKVFVWVFVCGAGMNGVLANRNVVIPETNEVGAQLLPDTIVPPEGVPFFFPTLHRPEFPALCIDIRERGAQPDSMITDLVNSLIDEVSRRGGGTVAIPHGRWRSGRIELKSRVNLHIAEGAELHFSGSVADCQPAVFTWVEGIELMGSGAFIYAPGQEDIAVTGRGIIFGPASDTEVRTARSNTKVIEQEIDYRLSVAARGGDGLCGRSFYRPKAISPVDCRRVLIEGVTIRQGVTWNIVPIYCDSVIVRGVMVYSVGIPTGDGIDIGSSRNVLIEYCTLSNGDDCFTMKAGRAEDGIRVNRPTENILIRHCLALSGHGGITCGSETAGHIRNVYVHDCVFQGNDRAVRFKTRRNRGGGVDGFFCERIRMNDVREAFTWDLLGQSKYVGDLAARVPAREMPPLTPVVRNIHICDFVIASADRLMTGHCIPEAPLSDVSIENGRIHCRELVRALDDVDGFTLRNLDIAADNERIHFLDARRVTFDRVRFSAPSDSLTLIIGGEKSSDIRFIHTVPGVSLTEPSGCGTHRIPVALREGTAAVAGGGF